MLAEAGLLPGALRRNATLRFEHRWVRLSVERHDTPFTRAIPEGATMRMPIAHGEGNYYLPDDELDALESGRPGGVPLRGAGGQSERLRRATSRASSSANGRVCGLMPHPERASEALLGSDDGLLLLRSLVESAAQVEAAA